MDAKQDELHRKRDPDPYKRRTSLCVAPSLSCILKSLLGLFLGLVWMLSVSSVAAVAAVAAVKSPWVLCGCSLSLLWPL